jgi:hypothetical protein
MQPKLALIALAICSTLLTSCDEILDEFHESNRYKEDFKMNYVLKSGARLTLENMNGSVEILGWEKESVDVMGTKYASDQDVLKRMKIDVTSTPDSIAIRTIKPDGHRGGAGAKYVLRVPYKVLLDRVRTSNGSIRVENVEGLARLSTSNGSTRVIRVRGPVEANTSNSSIEATDVEGDLKLHTSNGSIRAENVKGAFEADTSNSSITARITDPKPDTRLKLDTSNGSIDLTLAAYRNNEILADTSNSSITVRLPGQVDAQLRASTSDSNITTDYEIATTGKMSKSHMEGRIGKGGPMITLDTSNGSIRLLKNLR